jgi:hypothetical protein
MEILQLLSKLLLGFGSAILLFNGIFAFFNFKVETEKDLQLAQTIILIAICIELMSN